MTMNASPYRTTCERCSDLEDQLTRVKDQRDQFMCDNAIFKEKIARCRYNAWSQRLMQGIIIGIFVAGAGLTAQYVHGYAQRPAAPQACIDSAEIFGAGETERECTPGAQARITQLSGPNEGRMLIECVCGKPSDAPDAGTQEIPK